MGLSYNPFLFSKITERKKGIKKEEKNKEKKYKKKERE